MEAYAELKDNFEKSRFRHLKDLEGVPLAIDAR